MSPAQRSPSSPMLSRHSSMGLTGVTRLLPGVRAISFAINKVITKRRARRTLDWNTRSVMEIARVYARSLDVRFMDFLINSFNIHLRQVVNIV